MGGENESTVEQKTPARKGAAGEQVVGSVRVHESNREIHFHDDANHRKVAVPVATWYAGWERLSNRSIKKFVYVDTTNKTQLTVRTKLVDTGKTGVKGFKPPSKNLICAFIEIVPVEFDDEFSALQKLTKGS